MLKFLKSFASIFQTLLGGLFAFFGMAVLQTMDMARNILEVFGLLEPRRRSTAADEAEDAFNEAQQPQFGSALDKKTVTWTPNQKATQIVRWCYWRTGYQPGPEPSLAGLTTREIIKLKSADETTLKALSLRTLEQIEVWMQSPKKALSPLTPSQLAAAKSPEKMGREAAEAGAKARLTVAADADSVLREIKETLSFRPAGPSFG